LQRDKETKGQKAQEHKAQDKRHKTKGTRHKAQDNRQRTADRNDSFESLVLSFESLVLSFELITIDDFRFNQNVKFKIGLTTKTIPRGQTSCTLLYIENTGNILSAVGSNSHKVGEFWG